jgi:hypothetical protein
LRASHFVFQRMRAQKIRDARCARARWRTDRAYVHSKKNFAQFASRDAVGGPESIKKERISAK